jgi:quercetin dioxygenase-like cupin family protein
VANIPDVLVAASNAYTLLLENDKVRVMEIRLKPGQKAPMHNHPNDHVIYVVKDAQLTLTSPDGKNTPVELKAGKGLWLEAGSHAAENTGKSDVYNVVIEIKK